MPDRREYIRLDRLDPAPWNPKTPISGEHKIGLDASLDTFGLRDDLKVWPNPDQSGRYFVLDGNQRLGRLSVRGEEEAECRVLDDLSPEDAKLFTASFDRNFAYYDKDKLGALAEELKAKGADLITKLLRPDRPSIPLPQAGEKFDTDHRAEMSATVPMMFQVTREGYETIKGLLASARSRLKRQGQLCQALESLAEHEVDDVVVETALLVASRRDGNGETGA